MDAKAPRAGAAALEVLLVIALISAVVFGLARTVFSTQTGRNALPDEVITAVDDTFGPRYLGEIRYVRTELSPDVEVRTSPTLHYLDDDGLLPKGRGQVSGPYEAQVNAAYPTGRQLIGLVGGQLVQSLATIAVLLLALSIVKTLRKGDPFLTSNARRLRWVALIIAVGGIASQLLTEWGQHLVLSDRVIAPFVKETFSISLLPLFAGLGVWLLAEVFRRGALMREDLEGLV